MPKTWLDDLQPADLFYTIFEAADLGVVLLTTDGHIHRANPAFQKMCQATVDQLGGRLFASLITAETRPLWEHYWEAVQTEQRPGVQLELQLQPVTDTDSDADVSTPPVWIDLTLTTTNKDIFLTLVRDITPRKVTEADLRELRRRLAQSREKTQLRLAQDLHDGPMQDLYAAQFQLQALTRRESLQADAQAQKAVHGTQQIFRQVNQTLRQICGDLRPPALVPFGLAAAVRSHAEQFRKRYPDLQLTLNLDDDDQRLPEHVRLALFRICQEALNNVAKHAQATRVLINLRLLAQAEYSDEGAKIVLEVQDNGRGFDVPARWIDLARREHLGLVGAAERAEDIDGQFLILSTPGKGTIVRVTAPLTETNDAGEN